MGHAEPPGQAQCDGSTLNQEMLQVLDAVEFDDEAKVLVLTGAGAAWTAGMDLKEYFREIDGGSDALQEKCAATHRNGNGAACGCTTSRPSRW